MCAVQEFLTILFTHYYKKIKLSGLYKQYRLSHNNLEFSKDAYDPDGQELDPWYPGGTYQAFTLDADYSHRGWQTSGRQTEAVLDKCVSG